MPPKKNEPKPEAKILHTIDGISEYDNPTPPWILGVFFATLTFMVGYQIFMPSLFGPGLLHWSQYKKYDAEMASAAQHAAATQAAAPAGGIATLVKDPAAIAAGKAIFAANCAACHGADAHGAIGPNLVKPPYWAYGDGKPEDLEQIVTNGTSKGMPTWGPVLGKTKVDQAVAYVYSLEHPDGK